MIDFIRYFPQILIFAGAFGLITGSCTIYDQRNISMAPEVMLISDINQKYGEFDYVSISGGEIDAANIVEYALPAETTMNIQLPPDYYIPIVNPENAQDVYIIRSVSKPSLPEASQKIDYAGLLKSKTSLPDEVRAAYNKKIGGVYYYLNTGYKPKTLLEKILGLKTWFLMLVSGFALWLLKKRFFSKKVASNSPLSQNHTFDLPSPYKSL